mgnify:CR=1 FL=1
MTVIQRDYRVEAVGSKDTQGKPIVYERNARGVLAMFHGVMTDDLLTQIDSGGTVIIRTKNMARQPCSYKIWREFSPQIVDAAEDGAS